MAGNVHELRPKAGSDTEKITINLGYVDLGHIDLLVQDGFYSNRTDFIRTAIRNQIERHADATGSRWPAKSLDLGLRHYSREDLEAARAAGQMLDIRVLGLASIAADVTPELARATIASVIRARGAARQPRGEGRPGRPHPLIGAHRTPAAARIGRSQPHSTIDIPRRDTERACLARRTLGLCPRMKAPAHERPSCRPTCSRRPVSPAQAGSPKRPRSCGACSVATRSQPHAGRGPRHDIASHGAGPRAAHRST